MHLPHRKNKSLFDDPGETRHKTTVLECPIPRAIDQDLREQIRRTYQKAVERVGQREDEYVQERLARVVSRLHAQGEASAQLAKVAPFFTAAPVIINCQLMLEL